MTYIPVLFKRDDAAAAPPAIDIGATAFTILNAALVFLMLPALGLFYSGMTRSKNALSLLFLSGLSAAVVSLEWVIWGYSLALSDTGSSFIGNFKWAGLRNVNTEVNAVAPTIPGSVYAIYQCMFAALTPALALGAPAERLRLIPAILFIFIWSTVVYNPVAYWTWANNGWARTLGALDFAGGGPVHMASGFAALAYSLAIGKRRGFLTEVFRPNSYSNILLGTALLWFGWFGFNAGSEVGANSRAGNAAIVTNLAAAVGAITWAMLNYFHQRKLSSFGFCSGAVVGLVAITPGSGYVDPWAAIVYGVLSATISHYAVELKHRLHFDDALDVFAVHGIGGFVGNLLTGIFANKTIVGLDAVTVDGGWINGHWMQVPYQLAASCAIGAWSFVITFVILKVINLITPIRVDHESELLGIDFAELGEYHIDLTVQSPGDGSPAHTEGHQSNPMLVATAEPNSTTSILGYEK